MKRLARPIKRGLDYFPMDVDFSKDIKIRRIINACGNESIYILHVLLASVYRDDGYYLTWNDDIAFLVADEVGTKEGTVNELVNKALQVDFFSKDLYERFGVLTSRGIQNRYIIATKERKIVELKEEYLLTKEVNRGNISIIQGVNEVKHRHNTQRKEKESKVKENKKDSRQSTTDLERDFNLLWDLYPKKTGKKDALKHYKRAIKTGVTNKEIQDGIVKYLEYIKFDNTPNQFIKAGSTYFNAESWTDEYDFTPRKNNKNFSQKGRTETLPDWAKEEGRRKETPLTPEEQAIIDEQLRALEQTGVQI